MRARTRTYSAVEKYRARLQRAEANLTRCETRHSDLQQRWLTALPENREGRAKALWLARLELNDAQDSVAACRRQLAEEEQRLLQPGSFLRFV